MSNNLDMEKKIFSIKFINNSVDDDDGAFLFHTLFSHIGFSAFFAFKNSYEGLCLFFYLMVVDDDAFLFHTLFSHIGFFAFLAFKNRYECLYLFFYLMVLVIHWFLYHRWNFFLSHDLHEGMKVCS